MEFTKFGELEKIHWYSKFKYKNFFFVIHDYKFGSWTIRAKNKDLLENESKIKELISEIHSKVSKSSKYFNKILVEILSEQIEKEAIFFNNVFSKLKQVFDFYINKINECIERREKVGIEVKKRMTPIGKAMTITNHKKVVEKEIEYYVFALMNSFFSILEFLLDCFFAFDRPNKSFNVFQKHYWNEKFKIIFDLKKLELKKLYDNIMSIKENYRNPLSHGLNNEVNFLVNIYGEGLVPINYEFLRDKPNFGHMTIPFEQCLFIKKVFNDFFLYLETVKPYKYYMDFIINDFSIPLNEKEISKIKANMISDEEWKIYLNEKIYRYYNMLNRDD